MDEDDDFLSQPILPVIQKWKWPIKPRDLAAGVKSKKAKNSAATSSTKLVANQRSPTSSTSNNSSSTDFKSMMLQLYAGTLNFNNVLNNRAADFEILSEELNQTRVEQEGSEERLRLLEAEVLTGQKIENLSFIYKRKVVYIYSSI